ncbi:hypothetical protein JKP88DRAFT_242931 [Tribonema minus]|uniref:WW domain-containing protein n=1 Tax=Tribonema minus TaxID=303371 RepID=A0A835ZC93_9STRA|nr:hypothetical protein JKP88DRAFT_242931 [Tribonema minus]
MTSELKLASFGALILSWTPHEIVYFFLWMIRSTIGKPPRIPPYEMSVSVRKLRYDLADQQKGGGNCQPLRCSRSFQHLPSRLTMPATTSSCSAVASWARDPASTPLLGLKPQKGMASTAAQPKPNVWAQLAHSRSRAKGVERAHERRRQSAVQRAGETAVLGALASKAVTDSRSRVVTGTRRCKTASQMRPAKEREPVWRNSDTWVAEAEKLKAELLAAELHEEEEAERLDKLQLQEEPGGRSEPGAAGASDGALECERDPERCGAGAAAESAQLRQQLARAAHSQRSAALQEMMAAKEEYYAEVRRLRRQLMLAPQPPPPAAGPLDDCKAPRNSAAQHPDDAQPGDAQPDGGQPDGGQCSCAAAAALHRQQEAQWSQEMTTLRRRNARLESDAARARHSIDTLRKQLERALYGDVRIECDARAISEALEARTTILAATVSASKQLAADRAVRVPDGGSALQALGTSSDDIKVLKGVVLSQHQRLEQQRAQLDALRDELALLRSGQSPIPLETRQGKGARCCVVESCPSARNNRVMCLSAPLQTHYIGALRKCQRASGTPAAEPTCLHEGVALGTRCIEYAATTQQLLPAAFHCSAAARHQQLLHAEHTTSAAANHTSKALPHWHHALVAMIPQRMSQGVQLRPCRLKPVILYCADPARHQRSVQGTSREVHGNVLAFGLELGLGLGLELGFCRRLTPMPAAPLCCLAHCTAAHHAETALRHGKVHATVSPRALRPAHRWLKQSKCCLPFVSVRAVVQGKLTAWQEPAPASSDAAAAAADEAGAALPDGWGSAVDEATGHTYFYSARRSTWRRPTQSASCDGDGTIGDASAEFGDVQCGTHQSQPAAATVHNRHHCARRMTTLLRVLAPHGLSCAAAAAALFTRGDAVLYRDVGAGGALTSASVMAAFPDDTYLLAFEDGRTLSDRVAACYGGGTAVYYGAVMCAYRDDTYDVRYNDGDVEVGLARSDLMLA